MRRVVKISRTSDSVRSIRSLLSSVRFSEDLFSSSPSSLKTLTSSSLPRSSPPPLLLTCGIIAGTRATATVLFLARSVCPYANRLGSARDVRPSAAIRVVEKEIRLLAMSKRRRRRRVVMGPRRPTARFARASPRTDHDRARARYHRSHTDLKCLT